MSERGSVSRGWVVAIVLALLLAWLLVTRLGKGKEAQEPPATRGPSFPPESIASISLDSIKAYAGSLHFEEGLGADSQLVDFKRGLIGTGRSAVIQPEIGSYRLERSDLAAGRIIARIRTDSVVPQLGFGPHWTWWWVDQHGPSGAWRSVYIAANEKSPAERRRRLEPLEMDEHGGPGYGKGVDRYRQALARWEVVSFQTPAGDPFQIASWGSCKPCCKQRLPVVSP